ncbi:VWA domain-containing protein [Lutibacter sp. B2]|nr:VWA domain-containing protein [Lutibacter sp. B2]
MKNKLLKKILCIKLVILLCIGMMMPYLSYAAIDMKAPVNMVRECTNNQVLKNEVFTVNYKFQPQPIPVENIIPETYLKEKDIVIVMDTSGSMDYNLNGSTRMSVAKNAAKLFVDNLKDDERVNIALVDYDNLAHSKTINGNEFVNIKEENNYSSINNVIESFTPDGGTNIGDGLRRGYYLLKNRDNDSKKYIILLTDGEPTYHSYKEEWITKQVTKWRWRWRWEWNGNSYYKKNYKEYYEEPYQEYNKKHYLNDGYPDGYEGGGHYATDEDIEYSCKVAEDLIVNGGENINSFMIAFTNDSNANILENIADNANGYYKKALTAESINEVYEQLSEQIASDLPIHGINFQEIFNEGLEIVSVPEGMKINGQTVTGDIGSINYNLNDKGTFFEAEPFEFSITLKSNNTGTYILGENNSSSISYTDIDGTENTVGYFNSSKISVYENDPPEISANITNSIDNQNNYNLNFRINEAASEIKVLNANDHELWTGSSTSEDSFHVSLNKNDLIGNYIKIIAVDQYNNEVSEYVPLIHITSLEVEDELNENNKKNTTINIQTENNSTITEIKVNNTILEQNKLTSNGEYSSKIELPDENSQIYVKVINGSGNTAQLYYNISVDYTPPNPPIIVQNDEMLNGKVDVTITSREGAAIEYMIEGDNSWHDYSEVLKLKPLTTIYARCTDAAGNVSSISIFTTFDTTSNAIVSVTRNLPDRIARGNEYNMLYRVDGNKIGYVEEKPAEIVLILNTSATMKNHIGKLKEAAKNFIDSLPHDKDLKVGVVRYYKYGEVVSNLVDLRDSNAVLNLKNSINGIRTDSGTNLGEGLRLGYQLLDNGMDADKHFVIMSDGYANTAVIKKDDNKNKHWQDVTYVNNLESSINSDIKNTQGYSLYGLSGITTYKDTDTNHDGLKDRFNLAHKYVTIIANEINKSTLNINTHMIHFKRVEGEGNDVGARANNNEVSTLLGVTKEVKPGQKFFLAENSDELTIAFNNVASVIEDSLSFNKFEFDETFPSGVQIIKFPNGLTLDTNNNRLYGSMNSIKMIKQNDGLYKVDGEFNIKIRFKDNAPLGDMYFPGGKADYIEPFGSESDLKTVNINNGSVYVVDDSELVVNKVTISSNNENNTGYAKVGDQVTLIIETNKDINTPNAEILGETASIESINGSKRHWRITYTLKSSDKEGKVNFNISLDDKYVDNTITVSSTTDGSEVIFDRTPPTATIDYNITEESVIAALIPNEEVEVINNDGSRRKTFIDNKPFEFMFKDKAGNIGSTIANVDWLYNIITDATYVSGIEGEDSIFRIGKRDIEFNFDLNREVTAIAFKLNYQSSESQNLSKISFEHAANLQVLDTKGNKIGGLSVAVDIQKIKNTDEFTITYDQPLKKGAYTISFSIDANYENQQPTSFNVNITDFKVNDFSEYIQFNPPKTLKMNVVELPKLL